MIQSWLDVSSSTGGTLRATDTIETCQKHREESSIIPEGKRRGWIQSLNVDRLKKRVREDTAMQDAMLRRIKYPETSLWFDITKTHYNKAGKKAESIFEQMQSYAEMQPGYYGEVGWEALREVLVELYIYDTSTVNLEGLASQPNSPIAPLSAQSFVEHVLLPELVCVLICDDYQRRHHQTISIQEARQIRNESSKYGIAMFPSARSKLTKFSSGQLFETSIAEPNFLIGATSDDIDSIIGRDRSPEIMPTRGSSTRGRFPDERSSEERQDHYHGSNQTNKMRHTRKPKSRILPSHPEALQKNADQHSRENKQALSLLCTETGLPKSSPSRPKPRPSVHKRQCEEQDPLDKSTGPSGLYEKEQPLEMGETEVITLSSQTSPSSPSF